MAGTIEVVLKIKLYWAFAKKMSGKIIKMHVFLCFEPFITSNSDAERPVVVPKPQM